MLPFKRILCPTDFSDTSRDALGAAAEIALFFQSELVVLHVVPSAAVVSTAVDGSSMTSPTVSRPDYVGQTRREAEMSLAEVVRDHVPDTVNQTLVVVDGDPAASILDMAEERVCDAIVIATQGRTGWRRFLFGSVAERVVRCAGCPVLTIRGKRAEEPPGDLKADEAVEA